MKRLTTILLLGILLFNWGGYLVAIHFLEKQADSQFEAMLDDGLYNDSELLLIRMPLNLPYYSNSPDFERADGEIVYNDVIYKYVKRRVYHDSLDLLCIPAVTRACLMTAREKLFMLANDMMDNQGSKKSAPTHNVKYSVSEYTGHDMYALNTHTDESPDHQWSLSDTHLIEGINTVLERPPCA